MSNFARVERRRRKEHRRIIYETYIHAGEIIPSFKGKKLFAFYHTHPAIRRIALDFKEEYKVQDGSQLMKIKAEIPNEADLALYMKKLWPLDCYGMEVTLLPDEKLFCMGYKVRAVDVKDGKLKIYLSRLDVEITEG